MNEERPTPGKVPWSPVAAPPVAAPPVAAPPIPSYAELKPILDEFHNILYNAPDTAQRNVTKSPSYKYEESRLLKAHITSVLTKYVNTLYHNPGDKIPYMYDYTQTVIGIFTIMLYYCAAPFICNIILEDIAHNKDAFVALLDDKFFSDYWKYNTSKRHAFNSFASKSADNSPVNAKGNKNMNYVRPKIHYTTEEIKRIVSFEDVHKDILKRLDPSQTRYNAAPDKNNAALRKFIARMIYIRDTFWTYQYKNIDKDIFAECMEDLRTLYVFYFKGGNSIRAIVESFNERASTNIKINDIDKTIPYGSDFDTNILINPYLPLSTFNKIQSVMEAFIPQISQYIKLPIKLKDSLISPDRETMRTMFTNPGNPSEQELQMNIAMNVYDKLNKHYVTDNSAKPEFNKVTIMNKKLEEAKRKPIVSISPDIETVTDKQIIRTTVVLNCSDPIIPDNCNSSISSKSSQYYPYMYYARENALTKYMSAPNKESCFKCLQYSINETIAKFRLHRFFLKFQFGQLVKRSNGKHRLINEEGFYNAEMFDISIVQPYYILNSTKDHYTCELIELWNNAGDIYKRRVIDKYGLLRDFANNVPMMKGSDTYVPLFINGIDIQINDIVGAIQDTINQGNIEKLPKRIKRLRLLNYLKALSPQYTADPVRDILVFDKYISLDIPINNTFYEMFTMFKQDGHDKYLHRAIWEYYLSQVNNKFFKGLASMIQSIEYNGITTPLNGLIGLLMNEAIVTYRAEASHTAINCIYHIHTHVKTKFQSLFVFMKGDETQKDDLEISVLTHTSRALKYKPSKFSDMLAYSMNDSDNDYRISILFADIFVSHIKQVIDESKNISYSAYIYDTPRELQSFLIKILGKDMGFQSSGMMNVEENSNQANNSQANGSAQQANGSSIRYETSVLYDSTPSPNDIVISRMNNIMAAYARTNADITALFFTQLSAYRAEYVNNPSKALSAIQSRLNYDLTFNLNEYLSTAVNNLFTLLQSTPYFVSDDPNIKSGVDLCNKLIHRYHTLKFNFFDEDYFQTCHKLLLDNHPKHGYVSPVLDINFAITLDVDGEPFTQNVHQPFFITSIENNGILLFCSASTSGYEYLLFTTSSDFKSRHMILYSRSSAKIKTVVYLNDPRPIFPDAVANGGSRTKPHKRRVTRRKLKIKSRNPKRHTRNVKKRMYK